MASQFAEYGLSIYPQGQAPEVVRLKGMDVSLIASGDGTEVIHHRLRAGQPWVIGPVEGYAALECLYVLKGKLVWESPNGTMGLNSGDSISCYPILKDAILTAVEETEFLYISSQPVFHLYSEQTRELMAMAVSIEEKDGYTVDHCQRIMNISVQLGREMGLKQSDLYTLHLGAFLHDIGKLRVPDHILLKPDALTDEEWVLMRNHPVYGRDILTESGLPFLIEASHIVEQHHERYNGSGYPNRLSRDEISLGAAIVGVVDSFDAMTTDRIYRKALDTSAALEEILSCKGILYHPDVVDAFLSISNQLL